MKLQSNHVAFISGAASGLGAQTARHLVSQGISVVGADLQIPEETIEGVHYIRTDVTDPAQVKNAIAQAMSLGELRYAIACAGIAPSMRIIGRKGTHDPEFFAKVIGINLIGTFHVLTYAAEAMAALDPVDNDGQRGVVILTASVAAFEGQIGQAAYSSSKGGVHALTLTAARDLAAQGIRVCAIAPGVVNTPMMAAMPDHVRHELEQRVPFPQRMAYPEEYGKLAQSIIENDYLNGETIRLDGALRMGPR